MKGTNFADLWEAVADAHPDAPAQVQGARRISWSSFDRRADGLAQTLLGAGFRRQDKVAQYLHNCPEYLESLFGIVKAGLVPVNTNYRYRADELVYLFDNADAVAIIFHGAFAEVLGGIRHRLHKAGMFVWIDDGSGACPDWAVRYEDAATSASTRVAPPWGRSGEDIYMLYTGGTTGLPKGVMWRQQDVLTPLRVPSIEEILAGRVRQGPVMLPACPLMHGTGATLAFGTMGRCGCVVTLTSRSLDPVELLDTVERERVQSLVIVGDSFAKPLLQVLEADPDRWNLSSLTVIASAGTMLSADSKRRLLERLPDVAIHDLFGSSEGLGVASSRSVAAEVAETAHFVLSEGSRVISEDGRDVQPGEIGLLAVKGITPVGYYKDSERSAKAFRLIDGVRYSVAGDYAMLMEDGRVQLLGRGSGCINTGGEKVFPEEVEEILKEHPDVHDAAVVGVPDDRLGESVTALVEPIAGVVLDPPKLILHVKERLAGYKAPRQILAVDSVRRSPSGKLDYVSLKQTAVDRLSDAAVENQ